MIVLLIVVFYYRISQSDMSIVSLSMYLFLTIVFDLFVVDFDPSLPVGCKFFWSNDNKAIKCLLGLDSIFK